VLKLCESIRSLGHDEIHRTIPVNPDKSGF
jgi:hypothetical protein